MVQSTQKRIMRLREHFFIPKNYCFHQDDRQLLNKLADAPTDATFEVRKQYIINEYVLKHCLGELNNIYKQPELIQSLFFECLNRTKKWEVFSKALLSHPWQERPWREEMGIESESGIVSSQQALRP